MPKYYGIWAMDVHNFFKLNMGVEIFLKGVGKVEKWSSVYSMDGGGNGDGMVETGKRAKMMCCYCSMKGTGGGVAGAWQGVSLCRCRLSP